MQSDALAQTVATSPAASSCTSSSFGIMTESNVSSAMLQYVGSASLPSSAEKAAL